MCVEICDDGLIVGTETCDDNIPSIPEWGCFADCKGNWTGWDCTLYPIEPTVCTEICGDGIIAGNEQCDDGNTIDNLGCLADCSGNIPGWLCENGTYTH